MRKPCKEIHLASYDELFGLEPETDRIIMVPLIELYEFKNHPFLVKDDEQMEKMTESIRQYGVLNPGLVRPRAEGGYEIISGHRRKRASELAGKMDMPVIVKDYSDDEATILMVDSNIQRENILPSEKAKSYKMKYDALKHQGIQTGKTTLEEMAEAAGENPKAVQRYVWLANLNEDLLTWVDEKRLGFVQGVNLSFLSEQEQRWAHSIIRDFECSVPVWKSQRLKECSKKGELSFEQVQLILRAATGQKRNIILKDEQLLPYFDGRYSDEEIVEILIGLLEQWKKKQR